MMIPRQEWITQEKKYKQGDEEKLLEKIKPKDETQECGVEKIWERERERERDGFGGFWRLTCSGLNLVEIGEIQHQQQGLLSSCGREGHASGFFFFFYEESSEFVIERRDSRSKNTIALCKPSSWFISCLADFLWLAALSHPLLTLVNGAWFRCNLVHLSLSLFISIYPSSSSSSSPLHHDLFSAKKDVNFWWWVPRKINPHAPLEKQQQQQQHSLLESCDTTLDNFLFFRKSTNGVTHTQTQRHKETTSFANWSKTRGFANPSEPQWQVHTRSRVVYCSKNGNEMGTASIN